MSVLAQMGWNPDAPTNSLRVSLLAYLRVQLRQLEYRHQLYTRPKNRSLEAVEAATQRTLEGPGVEHGELQRWIAWLEGAEVLT